MDIVVLIAAGLLSGALNAVAGGGTFISLPALIWLGVPPVTANATATLGAMPGYASAAWGFRHDMAAEGALSLRAIMLIASIGSVIGALLLVVTPGTAFLVIVPWLLLLATVLFAAGPKLIALIQRRGVQPAGIGVSATVILSVGTYGGYFNGGLGIMLLAAFGLIGFTNLHGMNGLKNILSALLSLVSSLTFILADLISWEHGLVLAISGSLGGYLGARLSRRITRLDLLRAFITLTGAIMTLLFFVRP